MDLLTRPLDRVLREVNGLSRRECIDRLTHFEHIPLDFDESFLRTMSVERMRHILMAAVITARRNATHGDVTPRRAG